MDLDGPIPGYQLKGCAQDVTAPMPPQIPASGWAREHTHTHTQLIPGHHHVFVFSGSGRYTECWVIEALFESHQCV